MFDNLKSILGKDTLGQEGDAGETQTNEATQNEGAASGDGLFAIIGKKAEQRQEESTEGTGGEKTQGEQGQQTQSGNIVLTQEQFQELLNKSSGKSAKADEEAQGAPAKQTQQAEQFAEKFDTEALAGLYKEAPEVVKIAEVANALIDQVAALKAQLEETRAKTTDEIQSVKVAEAINKTASNITRAVNNLSLEYGGELDVEVIKELITENIEDARIKFKIAANDPIPVEAIEWAIRFGAYQRQNSSRQVGREAPRLSNPKVGAQSEPQSVREGIKHFLSQQGN